MAAGGMGRGTVVMLALILFWHTMAFGDRVVIDQTGRHVRLHGPLQRVVALAPSMTEIIFALGQGDRLVGVTRFSNYPPETETIAKVGSYVQLDLEKIVALQPDICLATRDGNPRAAIVFLEKVGIPVYVVDPRDMATVIDAIQGLADLMEVRDQGRALTVQMQSRIDRVQSRVPASDQRPAVFFQVGIAPIISIGSNTFIDELITLAGGRNLAAGPVAYPRFSREQVLALDPDILVVTTMARDGSFVAALEQWRRWDRMTAVRSGRLYTVDSNLFDRPGPRLVAALEMLFNLLYPEQAVEGVTRGD